MHITLITSIPLNPPWDQGDKNLGYSLARALPQFRFGALTAPGLAQPGGENLELQPIFRSRRPGLAQKARVFAWLLAGAKAKMHTDLYHLIFRPERLSSWLLARLPEFRRRPTLQTVPATSQAGLADGSLFFAQRVVALSEAGRRVIERAGGRNVTHIPPGVDAARWEGLACRSELYKARLGLGGRLALLYPGHYGRDYGLDILLDALPRILLDSPGAALLLACRPRQPGDHARREATRARLSDAGLLQDVRIFDTVEDMSALIGASDVVVLPFTTMRDKVDIPTTLLEALAAGKPAVIADIAPMNELIHAGGPGMATPPQDAAALAEAVSALLRDAGLREQMGRQGQAYIRQRHDINLVAAQYAKLYREMVV